MVDITNRIGEAERLKSLNGLSCEVKYTEINDLARRTSEVILYCAASLSAKRKLFGNGGPRNQTRSDVKYYKIAVLDYLKRIAQTTHNFFIAGEP
ncbi:uncharacterized protein Bfra_002260 [Botrytis fragariae]|uniref:Uncharacterized protein n=1 Tax=Botrytis fragariae TaxID=1964551 RepID=A0A8H6EKS8_9HELO|nr:uncharacterized protein Bfra_002260 [Botrytis fragariae]KAF5875864.1 hypothetical protein Bfra_002260 [Botrytis fragariae]